MKIYSLAIVSAPQGGSAKLLANATDLSSFTFYQRGTLAEFLNFFSGIVAERASAGERQSFTDVDKQDSEYVFHVYNRGGEEQLAGAPSLSIVRSLHEATESASSRHGCRQRLPKASSFLGPYKVARGVH